MKKNKSKRTMTEEEKQTHFMEGETAVSDAFIKARQFAAQEKARLKLNRKR
ncbi:hypothetical protein [Endozoicomonas sp.]|uniref:hypothetical protein n=1 Tax=Endozoicomonas sp. TaxID=1892382 RepID=UPI003D9B3070